MLHLLCLLGNSSPVPFQCLEFIAKSALKPLLDLSHLRAGIDSEVRLLGPRCISSQNLFQSLEVAVEAALHPLDLSRLLTRVGLEVDGESLFVDVGERETLPHPERGAADPHDAPVFRAGGDAEEYLVGRVGHGWQSRTKTPVGACADTVRP